MTTNETETRLLEEILARVDALTDLRTEKQDFVPGKTPVPYAGRVYDRSEVRYLVESSLEFWLTAGRWHSRFERELARWYGVTHARLVNSGSSANLIATAALMSPLLGERRLHPGDEVITVAAGFPTTVAPCMQLGLIPVFVDVELPSANIDPRDLDRALSPRTRVVALAHALGNPFDLDAVTRFCREHDLWLIEDNCDASGSLYRGQKTGTFGHLATLSFYPPHHMTTGEGGAVLTSDETLNRIVESLRDWGRDCWCRPGFDNTCGKRFEWELGELPVGYDHKYIFTHLGFNLKMTDMQASIGVAQIQKLDGFVDVRRSNWSYFRAAFQTLDEFFFLPEPTPHSDPSWFGFLLTVRPEAPFTRDEIVRYLEGRRIHTRMLFAGNLTRQPALTSRTSTSDSPSREFRVAVPLETTDLVMTNAFWIGVYPGLTSDMREFVATEIHGFCKRGRRA